MMFPLMGLDTIPSGMPFTDTIYVYMHGIGRVFMAGVWVAMYIYTWIPSTKLFIYRVTHYLKCQLTK